MPKNNSIMDMPDVDEIHDVDEPKSVRISLHLIAKRHLPPESNKWPHDKMVENLNKITHVRLDREHISHIDNLELLGNSVTNLYLQHNCIENIENLDCLPNLKFVTLAYNRIRNVRGISRLSQLAFLDLSNNLIELFDIDELPQSLVILNFEGNPCTYLSDYRGRIIQDLPKLRQLDGEDVTHVERREVGYAVSSSSSEEEEEEEETPDDTSSFPDILKSATSDILLRSQDRAEGLLNDHKKKMSMLGDFRTKYDLLMINNDSTPSSRTSQQKSISKPSKKMSQPH